MHRLILFLALILCPLPAGAETGLRIDDQAAIILAYHRVGDDAHPSSNIRIEQFEDHMRYLHEENIPVLPLPHIISAIKSDEALPDRAVAITFDGAHASILKTALPILKKYGFPFTVFVPPHYADSEIAEYMSWDDLKTLKDDPRVTIGLQSALYTHLDDLSEEDIKRGVNNARSRYRDMIGEAPKLYAYPFGEISTAYRDFIAAQGFTAAFGQQSGTASPASDIYALPRFSMTEQYGDLDRFDFAISALPLPVTDIEPADPYITGSAPAIGFTLPPSLAEREDFECYAGAGMEMDVLRLGNGRVELRFQENAAGERIRINCTVPQGTDDPERPYRWRWFGLLLTQKGTQRTDTDRIE